MEKNYDESKAVSEVMNRLEKILQEEVYKNDLEFNHRFYDRLKALVDDVENNYEEKKSV